MVFEGFKIGEFRKWATFPERVGGKDGRVGCFQLKLRSRRGRRAFRSREITLPADSLEEGRMDLEEADLQEEDREKSTPLEHGRTNLRFSRRRPWDSSTFNRRPKTVLKTGLASETKEIEFTVHQDHGWHPWHRGDLQIRRIRILAVVERSKQTPTCRSSPFLSQLRPCLVDASRGFQGTPYSEFKFLK